jgi:hypothetical protein
MRHFLPTNAARAGHAAYSTGSVLDQVPGEEDLARMPYLVAPAAICGPVLVQQIDAFLKARITRGACASKVI